MNSKKNSFKYSSSSNQLRLIYLEIPLFLKLNFDPYSDIRPNVFFGPNLGFLAAAQDNFSLPQSRLEEPNALLSTEYLYNKFNPGFAFGAGLDIDIGDWTIFTMGVQYVHGLKQINKIDDYYFYEKS